MGRERGLKILWLAALFAAAAQLAWRLPQARLQTSIFDLVPWQSRHPAAEDGAQALRQQLQQKAMVLLGHGDPAVAIGAAEAYAAALRGVSGVAGVTCAIDEGAAGAALAFFEPWRGALFTLADRAALRGDGTALVDAAQQGLFMPPGFGMALGFQRDPFGTYGRWLAERASGLGRLGLSQGHLMLRDGGLSYAAVLIELAPGGGSGASPEALARGLDAAAQAGAAAGALSQLRAGFVFHELAAARQARAEVGRIGVLSLLLLGLLVMLVLPQWGPRLLAFAPVLVGSVCGAAAVLLLWRQVHLVALVFGSTVVGVAEDYGLVFLCGIYDPAPWDALERRRRIAGPTALALLTSVLGYAALLVLPIPALRQVAVFAGVGLAMDWAGVLLWYPALLRRSRLAGETRLRRARALAEAWPRLGRERWLGPVLAVVTLTGVAGLLRLKADDDLRLLYAHDAQLEAEQKEVTRLTGLGGGTGFFVVSASDAEALLVREEALLECLDRDPGSGRWTGVARLVPSSARQRADRHALEEALAGPHGVALRLQRRLGAPGLARRLRRALGTADPLTPALWLASPVSRPYRYLWLGPRDGVWSGLVVADGPIEAPGLARARAAAAGTDGVLYVDQLEEVTAVLAGLRRSLSWALAAGALVVLGLVLLGLGRAAPAALAPTALGGLAALAALGWAGLPFNLFALLGLILLLGTAIDFGIYVQAGGRRPLAAFVAVNLAALTNIAAVGVLAFSGTMALRSFGLVLAVGAGVAWLCAPCFSHDEREA